MNKLKCDQYEIYIRDFLLENNKYVWLWKDIPIINVGIRTDLNVDILFS
jgi:hypothetical protein